MTYDLSGAPVVPPLRGKGTLITGAVLLVLGLVGIILGIVMTAGAAASLLASIGSPQTSPTSFTRQLDGGTTYAVYEATGGGSGTAEDPFLGNVEATDITVKGASGDVPVAGTGNEVSTVGDSKQLFAEVATFTPPSTGSYTIDVATTGSLVAVAPALSSAAKGLAWIAAIVLGGLVVLIGIVVLIVGAVQRSSSRKQQQVALGGTGAPAQPYAAHSYPTPDQPAQPYAQQPYAQQPYAQQPYAQQPYPLPTPPVDPPDPAASQDASPTYAAPAPVAPPQPAVLPPAAWYPDPERPGGQRYWDGAAWTEHRA